MAARSGTVSRGRSRSRNEGSRLLPDGAGAFARRRLVEALSFTLALLGALILLGVFSFDSADPSLNRAVPGPVRNILGWPGAIGSDLALHSLGLGILLVPPALFAWAWRIWQGRGLDRWPLRVVVLNVQDVERSPPHRSSLRSRALRGRWRP